MSANSELRLQQNSVGHSLWHLVNCDSSDTALYGMLVVYVDDFLILAYDEASTALAASMQTLWKTTDPSRLTTTSELDFGGLEIRVLPPEMSWPTKPST